MPIPHNKPRPSTWLAALPLSLVLPLVACSTVPPAPAARLQDVVITFAARTGDTPVSCGQPLVGLGRSAAQAELRDLRFYVSELALIRRDGSAVAVQLTAGSGASEPWQNEALALIDLADGNGACTPGSPATNHQVRGLVPAGAYAGLRFTVGVPHALNHSDVASADAPLDLQAMAWAWQAGRKFMQVEINPTAGVARRGAATGRSFLLHLGATGCKGNPVSGETVACARPNRMQVLLPAFDSTRQQVVLDLAMLYAGSDIEHDGGGALGCMSGPGDPECAPLFQALGMDLASGLALDAGARQTVFRAAAR